MKGYSIDEWCEKHRISRGTWYNLLKADEAPRFLKIGSRIVITAEADATWCRDREAAAAANQEARIAGPKRQVAR